MGAPARRPVSPLARFAMRQHGLVTRAQAAGAGCTDARHADPRTFDADRRRDNALRELGWTVYRTTWNELAAGAGALPRQLRVELAGRRRPG